MLLAGVLRLDWQWYCLLNSKLVVVDMDYMAVESNTDSMVAETTNKGNTNHNRVFVEYIVV